MALLADASARRSAFATTNGRFHATNAEAKSWNFAGFESVRTISTISTGHNTSFSTGNGAQIWHESLPTAFSNGLGFSASVGGQRR